MDRRDFIGKLALVVVAPLVAARALAIPTQEVAAPALTAIEQWHRRVEQKQREYALAVERALLFGQDDVGYVPGTGAHGYVRGGRGGWATLDINWIVPPPRPLEPGQYVVRLGNAHEATQAIAVTRS